MCGIIGYVGPRASKPLLLAGLERLEYRGYDSAGLALLEDDGLDYVRAVRNLQQLKLPAWGNGSQSTTGLGHTPSAIHHDHPGLLVGARFQCPLVVGLGRGETCLASSIAAFLTETRQVQFIEDREVVAITPEGASFYSVDGGPTEDRDVIEVDWDIE